MRVRESGIANAPLATAFREESLVVSAPLDREKAIRREEHTDNITARDSHSIAHRTTRGAGATAVPAAFDWRDERLCVILVMQVASYVVMRSAAVVLRGGTS